ncbi:MAG: hypothetical protein M5U26_02360 [Planctomycetota bacterium]|nr:hypothetical protein [Planctomycetota bacterium]
MRTRRKRDPRCVLTPDLRRYYSEGGSRSVFTVIELPVLSGYDFEVAFCEDILKRAPGHFEALSLLGEAYARRGQYEKGLEADLKLTRMHPESNAAYYNLACSYALNARKDEALTALKRAVRLGYRDVEHLRSDRDLTILHGDKRFQRLIQRLRREARKAGR